MLHRIVRRRVKLKDIQRALLVERLTRLTLVARLAILRRILTVDGLGKDTCTGGFTYAARAAEQVGMGQFTRLDGILQRRRQGRLSYHCVKRHRPVFSGRNNILHK